MKLKLISLALCVLCLVTEPATTSLASGLAVTNRAPANQQFPVDWSSIWVWSWNQTNAFRQTNGLPALRLGPRQSIVANEYAEFLARNNASGHEADGRDPAQRVAARGIKNCGVWENVYEYWSAPSIASWDMVAAKAMDAWKESRDHRDNLLRAQATHMGIGAAGWTHDGKHYYKVVQVFIDDCIPPGAPRKKVLRP
jgi:uncharacterized protein YkwD